MDSTAQPVGLEFEREDLPTPTGSGYSRDSGPGGWGVESLKIHRAGGSNPSRSTGLGARIPHRAGGSNPSGFTKVGQRACNQPEHPVYQVCRLLELGGVCLVAGRERLQVEVVRKDVEVQKMLKYIHACSEQGLGLGVEVSRLGLRARVGLIVVHLQPPPYTQHHTTTNTATHTLLHTAPHHRPYHHTRSHR